MKNTFRLLAEGILFVIFLTVSFPFIVHSQNIKTENLTLSHSLNYHPSRNTNSSIFISSFPDTLYVYAIRVQFQQDNNPNTTGDGRFDMSNNYPDSVDAPPHDSLYFIHHLEFLKNYYYKSSKGKLIIKYFLLGGVRNLSNTMSVYSPGRNEGLQKLGSLFFDSWRSADSVIDFSGVSASNSAFVIFHAGAGRDIDLRSQGIFQGEQDLPSIFLGLSSLKSIYGDTLRGYYTNEGLVIPGSSVLPEQEYRVINSSFGNYFLELGLNGITVASVGSSLGLPDLFDTRTGVTAIGRFGLMDGQSIFSFSGIFPPEPSAWEKQFLGWVDPGEIISDGTYSSRAASIDFSGTSSVYKIFISGKEYFLLENRNRDAMKNGQKIFFTKNNISDSISFSSDQPGFDYAEIWKLKGCITDVDELDWSLPGLKNDTANYQGGILIWHIDENVIDANFSSNTINTNLNHRGVDLEEAKGVQQIGVSISTPFGIIIGDGTPYDFWYNGNHYVPSSVYRNSFDPTSFPNSNSYNNSLSRVCINNFNVADSVMTFIYNVCSPLMNISGFPRYIGKDTSGHAQPIGFDFNQDGYDEVFVNVKDSLFAFRSNGNSVRTDKTNGFFEDSAASFIAGFIVVNQTNMIVSSYMNRYNFLSYTGDSITGPPSVVTVYTTDNITSPVMNLTQQVSLLSGTISGKIARLNPVNLTVSYDSVSGNSITGLAAEYVSVNQNYFYVDNSAKFLTSGFFPPQGVLNIQSDSVSVSSDNKLFLKDKVISSALQVSSINSTPITADINGDGNQEIIFAADNKVFAVNKNGVVIDNFPIGIPGTDKISGGCSAADLNGDGKYEVIFGTADGRVYAYSSDGKVLDGFPLLTGGEVKSTPAIINSSGKFGLIVYSLDGYLYGWRTPWDFDSTRILWKNFLRDKYHTNANTGVMNSVLTQTSCMPENKVYNWPNPVYGNTTNIRYYLSSNASGTVRIKILDLSGEMVTSLNGTVNNGFDNEVVWDVSKVQSGIYIGIVEIEGGCNETASFKIAVVK